MSVSLKTVDALLLSAESAISLLDRCRPTNAEAEERRLNQAWASGRSVQPAFRYNPPPDLSELLGWLDTFGGHAQACGDWGRLYAARAAELALEARAVMAVGRPDFSRYAWRRFDVGRDEHARAAQDTASRYCALDGAASDAPRYRSDDRFEPRSLLSLMLQAVGCERLPFRVWVRAGLPSAAATGAGVILVRADTLLSERQARRIVLHEIEGHALPRARAAGEPIGLFRTGSAGGSADEEGRALLIEQRAGYLDPTRQFELGCRHAAAMAVRSGADWVQTVRLMQGLGAPLSTAIRLASRAHRGGGLAREAIYLVAMHRVGRALSEEPDLEHWLRRGRIGVEAARVLRAADPPPLRLPLSESARAAGAARRVEVSLPLA